VNSEHAQLTSTLHLGSPSQPSEPLAVSLVVLCRNEERTIESCLDSLTSQDWPEATLEILVADGMSTDRSREIVGGYQKRHPNVILVDNARRTAPCAFNIGAKAARGSLAIITGAHTTYPPDYVRLCVETIRRTGADLVGGTMVTLTRGEGLAGRLVQALTTHRFGVGGAQFRLGAADGPADTVPYGCYRRGVFDRIGWFDERLTRNQDYEFSRRILAAGGKIWCNPAIQTRYYTQATLRGLFKQAFGTGMWNPWTWFVAPYAFGPRHAIPGIFVLALLGAVTLAACISWGWIAPAAIMVPYLALALLASYQQACRFGVRLLPLLPPLFFAYHASYGLGTLWGALRLLVGATPVQKVREPWPGAGRHRAWRGKADRRTA